jgi:hypothetical protein
VQTSGCKLVAHAPRKAVERTDLKKQPVFDSQRSSPGVTRTAQTRGVFPTVSRGSFCGLP